MQRKIACISSCVLSMFGTVFCAEKSQNSEFTLLTDFVYMQRYHVKDKPVILDSSENGCVNGCSTNRVLDTKNLVKEFEPGVRAAFSYIPNAKSRYELGGLYLGEMDNSSTKNAKGILSVPFKNASFASDYYGADKISARYTSRFYTGELNYWRTFSHSFLVFSGLVGLRFAEISEDFTINTYKNRNHSSYDISAKNDLMGIQTGFDLRICLVQRFYWDFLVKAGVDLNRISSKVFLGNLNNTVTLRNYSQQVTQAGMFAEAAAGAGYQILDWLSVRVGYQMLFFGGLAQAPAQLDYSSSKLSHSTKLSGYHISKNGYVIIHGIYTGLVYSF